MVCSTYYFIEEFWTSILFVVTRPNHVLNHIFVGYLAAMQLLQPIVFSKRQNSYSSVFALWGKIDTSLMLKQWCLMQNHDCAQIQPGCSRLVRRALADKHRVLQCNYFSGNYPCWSSSQRWLTVRLPFVGSAAAKFKALCSIGVAAKVKTVPSRVEHIIFISNYKNYIIIRAWYSYEMHTIC